jgi:phytanoyl-CoA hydroxylase
MLTQEQIAQFHENGFLNGGTLLTDEQVDVLRDELERVIDDKDRPDVKQPVLLHNFTRDDSAPVWQIVNIWEASEPFGELIRSAKVAEGIAELTGSEDLRIWHDQIQYKPAEVGGVNMWHQDAPLWPIIRPMTEVSAWVALDDVDEENGCMSMVPGSHKWGDEIEYIRTLENFNALPSEYKGNPVKAVPCLVKKGEVHFHHALTWHGSSANLSDRKRRAIAIHYMTDETYYVANGEHVMKPFVDVADGERLHGEHFPKVWSKAG